MKRVLFLALATLVVGTLTFTGVRRVQSQTQKSGVKAFTAVVLEKRYAGTGEEGYSSTNLYAIRSDGSNVHVARVQMPNQEWVEMKSVLDVVAQKRVSVDPVSESLTTYPLSAGAAAEFGRAKTRCTDESSEAGEKLLGYETVKVRKEIRTGAGLVFRGEEWQAPGLNCFRLRETATLGPLEGAASRTTREVLFVIEGEPAASLFEIPSTYAERSPAQVYAEWERRFPGHRPAPADTTNKLDEVYHARQRSR